MMDYKIEKRDFGSTWIHVIRENAKKETMTIEIVHCTNPGGNNSLPYAWYKNGWTDKVMETWIGCNTYVHDSEGNCYGGYNVTIKYDGKRNVINFDWMLEDTEENEKKIIEECVRLFESAAGKSATEIKNEKILNYAKDKGMEVYTELPDGWEVYHSVMCPVGSDRIANMHPLKERKNPELKVGLLIM